MKFRLLAVVLVLLMVFTVGCNVAQNATDVIEPAQQTETETSASQELQILKSDIKLTQEQTMSQIKAEYLKQNDGYLENDDVVVMVTLPQDALIETFNNGNTGAESVAEYALTDAGQSQAEQIAYAQQKIIDTLVGRGLIESVEYQYSTIINAVAVKIKYGNLAEINSLTGVSSTILSETYNRPQSTKADASDIINDVDIYPTGIYNSGSVSYTGKGTSVAVLDSGFDCSHAVFQYQPDVPTSKLMYTQQNISALLDRTNAASLTKNLDISRVYYSKKIPFVYDYADKDPDVFPYDSEHGTHVAGIIGGYSPEDNFTGIAIDTQLVLMKVFPDLSEGGRTEDILAALEDAVLLGVDAINMSLGSSCGFAREVDEVKTNEVYDAINQSGISLITAASNSYSSGFGGAQGNTNFVTNPDSGTVGSPSSYPAALSVASISGTKSKYIVGNDTQIVFFKESNSITSKENDFFAELYQSLIASGKVKSTDDEVTLEYVTVPGTGARASYSLIDVKGKIALVRRGDNTFEEKAQLAARAGAVACIIYNNIDGDILMSMGKSDHIPTISISKDDGVQLAQKDSGTITISYKQQAGPFMSDFSSWGPLPSLALKPEITAHGGNILSSIPGGGYDELSGTSMATPNLCGIVVLIRQYIKDNYTTEPHDVKNLANQLLMSSATIIKNEEGNPYSPRKQGAGLASLFNAVNTKAYITVDGIDRSKLELGDDPQRTGKYEMTFNVVNLSASPVSYNLSLVGMTESVSTSDDKHVSETPQLLNGKTKVEFVSGNGSVNGATVTVNGSQSVKVKVTYTLTDGDKEIIDNLFPYGMYVEGFVKLAATSKDDIDLNVPFLAFYGDWTEAPMFDKTYYEVESQAHDASIDEEDKLKADYYATTPYGSYYYNYIIPLGTYLYDIDESAYDAIPASEEHIAISNVLGTIDGIGSIYAGLLRNAKSLYYTITDKVTGEVVWEYTDYNATKAYSYGGTPIPHYDSIRVRSAALGLVNNRQYEFKMSGLLDYGDGGATTNVRNTFGFDFCLDDEAPVIKEVSYERTYDRTLKKYRYYMNMTVYDNQYVMSVSPIIFTSASSYTTLTKNPIPVYGEKGKDCKIRFEITDYLEDIFADSIINSALAFSIDDYALNSNIFLCQLPGTRGEFSFTKDGTTDGDALQILSVYEGDVIDLTEYLATSDKTVDADKDYLKYLVWSSSNENVAQVSEGMLKAVAVGRSTISVQEQMDNNKAGLIINVRENTEDRKTTAAQPVVSAEDATLESLRFSYFQTLFAYSRAAQTSEIGETGSKRFISSTSGVSFYPGEKVKLFYDLDPWYAADNYEGKISYSVSNPEIISVDQDGTLVALKRGSAFVYLNVEGSNISARLRVTVKSEFVIENRSLIAYKGWGGEVVIPDDEGILYIGSFAFCLYDTDYSVELPEDDFDANKIPSANTTITSVVIPEGVEDIQKYAFYNCSGLKSVTIPESAKYIRDYAFYGDVALETIDLKKVEVVGLHAFEGCTSLNNVDLSKVYAIGSYAFDGCSSLEKADLTSLRNAGSTAFRNCTSLKTVVLNENTKLAYAMFVNTAVTNVDIYEKVSVPDFCFAQCKQLKTVTLHNDLKSVGYGAFSECESLSSFTFGGTVAEIGEQAFYADHALAKITLPNSDVVLGNYSFFHCQNLAEVELLANTNVTEIKGSVFEETQLKTFKVASGNKNYSVSADGHYLLNAAGNKVIFAATGVIYGDIDLSAYGEIGNGAFCGVNVTSVRFGNDAVIGKYAFANCDALKTVYFGSGVEVGAHAFNYASSLASLENLDKVLVVGDYAFANTGLKSAVTAANAVYGEGAFFRSEIETITIGQNTVFGLGAFQNCSYLKTVNMPENGGVHFGQGCFAYAIQLENIDLSKIDENIEKETFYGCTSLRAANLTTAKTVGDYAFADCSTLNYVNIPVAESLGEGAFGRYSQTGGAPIFGSITLPGTLKTMGDGVFLGCVGLEEIEIPASVQQFGDYMFAYCVNLKKVVLHENIKTVGKYCFAGCSQLTDINLGAVEEVGEYAFAKSANGDAMTLAKIDLSSAVKIGDGSFAGTWLEGDIVAPHLEVLGAYAFQNTYLDSFYAPALKVIGEGAFHGNEYIKEFVISEDVESVGSIAFLGCKALESFYYGADKANDGEINDYAKLVKGVLYTKMPSGSWQLMSVPANLKADGSVVTTLEVVEGTARVDIYAGNDNENVTKVILPDSMRLLGNYAFYGYANLQTVEFKSFTAPALEDSYNRNARLAEDAPGYELLHSQYDIFGLELYYYTFVDLVGSKKAIEMILPANADIEGYDSLVYEAYFGKVADAERSNYVAMDKFMINFIGYAGKIAKIETVTLSDETLINNAVLAYNSTKQNATDYGYSAEEWKAMVETVNNAKTALAALKLANAGKAVQNLQKEIDNLPTTFDISKLTLLADIAAKINALSGEDKSLLDLTNYNALVASYNAYREATVAEVQPIIDAMDNLFVQAATVAAMSVVGAALAFIVKRRFL